GSIISLLSRMVWMRPPTRLEASRMVTGRPASARMRAAVRPAMPAPMIRTDCGVGGMGSWMRQAWMWFAPCHRYALMQMGLHEWAAVPNLELLFLRAAETAAGCADGSEGAGAEQDEAGWLG